MSLNVNFFALGDPVCKVQLSSARTPYILNFLSVVSPIIVVDIVVELIREIYAVAYDPMIQSFISFQYIP